MYSAITAFLVNNIWGVILVSIFGSIIATIVWREMGEKYYDKTKGLMKSIVSFGLTSARDSIFRRVVENDQQEASRLALLILMCSAVSLSIISYKSIISDIDQLERGVQELKDGKKEIIKEEVIKHSEVVIRDGRMSMAIMGSLWTFAILAVVVFPTLRIHVVAIERNRLRVQMIVLKSKVSSEYYDRINARLAQIRSEKEYNSIMNEVAGIIS